MIVLAVDDCFTCNLSVFVCQNLTSNYLYWHCGLIQSRFKITNRKQYNILEYSAAFNSELRDGWGKVLF